MKNNNNYAKIFSKIFFIDIANNKLKKEAVKIATFISNCNIYLVEFLSLDTCDLLFHRHSPAYFIQVSIFHIVD